MAFVNLSPSVYVSVSASELEAQSFNPQGPARETELGKKVWFWYRVYCAAMALMYLCVAIIGVITLYAGIDISKQGGQESGGKIMLIGGLYVALGIIFAIPYGISPFLPRKPWHWIYGIVLISIGLTSCLCLPACIPLLIFWLKPEAKWMFGKE
jgi:hypothetical protein